MGSMGSDIAAEAADVALMSDDISKIPYLKRLSNATVKTIKVSITLSMCINFVAIALSLLKVLTPATGALVHNAGSCLVILIAALLCKQGICTRKCSKLTSSVTAADEHFVRLCVYQKSPAGPPSF